MNSGFVLPNVGPGPDPLSLGELEADFAVLLLHRDFYCSECRQQVRRVKKRYDEFEARDAEVVSVLPEDRETAAEWQKQYHLPFPVVADPDTELGDRYDQPTRFGLLGKLHDVIGRMPAVVLLDLRWSDPIETYAHRGDSRTDRPRIDEILDAIDHAATLDAGDTEEHAASEAAPPVENEQSSEPPTVDRVPPRSADDTRPADPGATNGGSTATETRSGDASTPDEGAELLDGERPPKPQRPLPAPESVDLPEDVELRRGTDDDVVAAMRVLQGALLDIDGSTVRDAAPEGELLLAEAGDWIVGALVLRDGHIEGVAVRRKRRGEGIGSALIEAAVADEDGTVTADFRAGVRGFWKDLGFEVEQEGSRFWGVRHP
ncbi:GNAT family N-acetyltransferase [Halolamina sp. C58]|uniref:GNAT family N-acetyltransferase n=1 Tax=Halolamina sp. C58 TaxID=3421640 RepID=UPI003EBC48DD